MPAATAATAGPLGRKDFLAWLYKSELEGEGCCICGGLPWGNATDTREWRAEGSVRTGSMRACEECVSVSRVCEEEEEEEEASVLEVVAERPREEVPSRRDDAKPEARPME